MVTLLPCIGIGALISSPRIWLSPRLGGKWVIINTRAFARAGLMGNPSDGYFGKTISVIVRDFSARVTLYHTPEMEILLRSDDHCCFSSMDELTEDVKRHGYYGGIRLLKATIKRFRDVTRERGIEIDSRNFTIRYTSDIPRGVGLAGSSAIITAALRALMQFYGVSEDDFPMPVQANVILSVERDELGISAGLQDRVIQVYEGMVYMDFARSLMEERGYGEYVSMDPALLPMLFIAYASDLSQGSEVFHDDIRGRFERGDPEVIRAMEDLAVFAERARECILRSDHDELGRLMDANFDRRASICRLSDRNLRMVNIGRESGASVKFAGSGGAVIGMVVDPASAGELEKRYRREGFEFLVPKVAPESAVAGKERK